MRAKGPLQWMGNYILQHPIITSIVYFTALIEPLFYMYPLFISSEITEILFNSDDWGLVWDTLWILIPISLLQVFLFFISSFLNEVLAHRITTDVTYDLFERMQDRSLAYHDSKDTGQAMTLAMNDTRSLNQFLSPGIRMILAAITIYLVAGLILASIDIILAYLLLITVIIFTYLVVLYRRKVGPISTVVLEELADVASIASDTLAGMRDIKSYHAEDIFVAKYTKKVMKQAISKELEGRAGTLFWPSLVTLFASVSMISYNIYLLYKGDIGFGDLVLITLALGLVYGFSTEFKWISFLMSAGLASNQRLYDFMSEEDPYRWENGTRLFKGGDASISFENVSFGYEVRDKQQKAAGFNHALRNISFTINDSETVAVVGGPGSGKSSLTKLIQRLYTPTDGQVCIGGIPINEYDNSSLRAQMATVEQEVHLFNDSVLENIRFGRPDATEEEVMEAARLAQADEFISTFENGYYTEIGDNGVRLSGGQAQRLAIARALIINPEILLLDDGASALDARTELKIQKAITEILKTRTTVITTHRLAIIAKADRVLVLENGEVRGFAPHEELILNNPYYRRFFERHYTLPALQEELK